MTDSLLAEELEAQKELAKELEAEVAALESQTQQLEKQRAAEAERARARDELAPLPAGIPYEVRLKRGGTVILAGMSDDARPV